MLDSHPADRSNTHACMPWTCIAADRATQHLRSAPPSNNARNVLHKRERGEIKRLHLGPNSTQWCFISHPTASRTLSNAFSLVQRRNRGAADVPNLADLVRLRKAGVDSCSLSYGANSCSIWTRALESTAVCVNVCVLSVCAFRPARFAPYHQTGCHMYTQLITQLRRA